MANDLDTGNTYTAPASSPASFAGYGVRALIPGFAEGRMDLEKHQRAMAESGVRLKGAERELDLKRGADQAWSDLAGLVERYSGGGEQAPAAAAPAGASAAGMPAPADAAAAAKPNVESGGDAASGTPAAMGPKSANERIGFGLYNNTAVLRNPKFMNEAAQIFLKAKMPDGVRWLEGSYKAAQENLIDAVKLASAGDLKGAEDAFNSTGQHKIQAGTLQWADAGKTTLRGVDAQGKQFEVQPQGLLRTFLSPEEFLKFEANRADARFKKVGDNLLRVNQDGTATPIYEANQYGATPDGDIYSKRTGDKKPEAASGVNGGTPKPGPRAQARVDDRVKMAIDKVILPKYGGRFEGGMFFPDEANKDVALRATELAGNLVRQGVDPEAAGSQAIAQAEREKLLKPKPGADPYKGQTPWKK